MESRLEEQYLREYDPSQFDRPSVTVDILVFTIYQKKLCVLLIKRCCVYLIIQNHQIKVNGAVYYLQ